MPGSSDYPDAVDTYPDTDQPPLDLSGPHVLNHAAGIKAIQEELGTNPAGDAPTVRERMETVESRYAVTQEAPVNVLNPPGALDPVVIDSDSTAEWAAIAAALPSDGGEVYVPPSDGNYLLTDLDLFGKKSVTVRGAGGRARSSDLASKLIFTGNDSFDRLLDLRETEGVIFRDLGLIYNSPAFDGTFVDLANDSGDGANDTHLSKLDNCKISGNNATSGINASELVGVQNTHTIELDGCVLTYGQHGVKGKDDADDYSNNIVLRNCLFENNAVAHLYNADVWESDGCTYQPLTDGKCGIYRHDATIRARVLAFKGGWVGDITVDTTGEPHIEWAGDVLMFQGGEWKAEHATAKFVVIDENTSDLIMVLGGQWVGPGTPIIEFGSTSGHQGVFLIPGAASGVATTGGTVPTNAIVMDANGRFNGIQVDGNILLGLAAGSGALVARYQVAGNPVVAARASGQSNDQYILNHDGTIARGSGSVAAATKFLRGTGSPESVVTAGPGSIFQREDGGAATSMYVKESGTGNTGWVAK